ncbi:hypothetical protein N7492_005920 [Penicillium capsulatum]|uniref:Grh/CP2 DB domain-containing protein n=1 Tax=Penicillium capsulatum TaxID=69766 RepID=A0A9W9IGQ7_9EURO|nr:hypothetical protein N7492_005920 [Penicillium capsulatum]KAJ6134977.1 hypothetical protein N7512_000137 [Penicillium capsulatum]
MLCHRKGSQKPDSALINRFQKLCGSSFFHGNSSDKSSNDLLSDKSQVNLKRSREWAFEPRMDSAMGLNQNVHALNDSISADSSIPSPSPPWVPRQGQDFYLFSSGTRMTPLFPSQSIPQLSPKSSLKEDVLPAQGDYQMVNVDTKLASAINPAQLLNTKNPAYDGIDESPDSGIDLLPPATQISPAKIQEIPQYAPVTDTSHIPHPGIDQFRFRTTFQSSTAMISAQDEVPESYLNKGKVYHLKVRDSMPPTGETENIRYRTSIRISFDQDDQRADPNAYWRLWKENQVPHGRQSPDQRPVAVEYVGQDHASMRIERVSLDGFCVSWTCKPDSDTNGCCIPVRFNFLSTDFTRSKGVKGMSVRLCAKTEQISPTAISGVSELCFCKVKLFRDHGAERKLSNDATSILKKVNRLRQQFQEAPILEPPIKRRRSRGDSKSTLAYGASKQALKRRDVWPPGLDDPSRADFQDHLQNKIGALQMRLESTISESGLCLRGDIRDDPDLCPISPMDQTESELRRPLTLSASRGGSSSPESISLGSTNLEQTTDDLDQPDVPVACFFTLLTNNGPASDRHYRAIYPTERTAHGLAEKISEKYLPQSTSISQILYITQAGLEILVDDDFVRAMTENQAMELEIGSMAQPGVEAADGLYWARLTY